MPTPQTLKNIGQLLTQDHLTDGPAIRLRSLKCEIKNRINKMKKYQIAARGTKMPERNFTYYFKHNLAERLQSYFNQKSINLTVRPECRIQSGEMENRIDIGIIKEEPIERIVGIEIEVISQKAQIIKNYNNFKLWVHASPHRKGGLLHILSSDSDIYPRDLGKILVQSYLDINKAHNFYYELMKLDIEDYRKTSELAKFFVEEDCMDWEFETRLFSLLSKVFGNRYLPY